MRQHCLGPVHVEHLAAKDTSKAAARLARSIAGRLKAACQHPTAHISFRSNLFHRATPEIDSVSV